MKTLIHFPFCPYCRKTRLQLAEKKILFNLETELYWKKREEFLDINPAGQVPVFIDEKIVIPDSNAISEYLEEVYPEFPLLPLKPIDRAEVRRLVAYVEGIFAREVTRNIFYEKTMKRVQGQGGPDSQNLREGQKALTEHLDYFSYLIENRTYLALEQLTIADLTLAAHLSCIDFLGHVPWDSYPQVKDWYLCLKSRPSFKPLLEDVMPGVTPSETYAALDF